MTTCRVTHTHNAAVALCWTTFCCLPHRKQLQELQQKHGNLVQQLEDTVTKGAQAVNLLNAALPESVRHGQLTGDCITGVFVVSATANTASGPCGLPSGDNLMQSQFIAKQSVKCARVTCGRLHARAL